MNLPVPPRLPQDREGQISTAVFERYRHFNKALTATLAEIYVSGTSTRKVAKLVETLCGHEMSHATISNLVAELDKVFILLKIYVVGLNQLASRLA